MHIKILITILFVLLTIADAFCKDIQPLDTTKLEERQKLAKEFLKRNKQTEGELKSEFTAKEYSYIKPIFKRFQDEMQEDILKGNYISYFRFDSIVNITFDRIFNSNSFLNRGPNFYISRDISLNAMSTFNNTFIINLGAFYLLKSPDELAAIIAHEQAHNHLKHQIKSLKKSFSVEKKDAKASVSEIKKSKYGRGSKALDKYKSMLYEDGTISRRHEFEADSLGYVLYRQAGYEPTRYLNAFRLMIEYDTIQIKEMDQSIYKKVFDLPNLPFNEGWMKQEDFSKYEYNKYKNKFNEDSISSHPELKERVEHLKKLFPELENESLTEEISDSVYKQLRHTAFYETFQSLDISKDYGFGIYACLSQISRPESNSELEMKYYKAWLGKYFTKIHQARKDYTLNKYLDALDPKNQSKEYQQFLSFMWNLNLRELEQIAMYYSKQ